MNTDLVIGMAGSGGDGIVSAGESLLTAAALVGYHGVLTKSFGPQIRGGESSFRLRLCTEKVLNPGGTLDIAVALNWEDFLKFGAELPVGGQTTVVYDTQHERGGGQDPAGGRGPRRGGPGAHRADGAGNRRQRPGQEHRRARPDVGLAGHRPGGGRWPASGSACRRRAPRSSSAPRRRSTPVSSTPSSIPLKTNRLMVAPADADGEVRGGRQRPVRGGGDRRRLRVLRRLSRSRRRRRSCTSSAARSGSTAGRCCRPKTRSRASARWSARRSPARRR